MLNRSTQSSHSPVSCAASSRIRASAASRKTRLPANKAKPKLVAAQDALQQTPADGETLIKSLLKQHIHLSRLIKNLNPKAVDADEQIEALDDERLKIERQIALATPTCLQDAIIQQELAIKGYAAWQDIKPEDNITEDDLVDCHVTDIKLMQQALGFMKSIQKDTRKFSAFPADPVPGMWKEFKELDAPEKELSSDDEGWERYKELGDQIIVTPSTTIEGLYCQVTRLCELFDLDFDEPKNDAQKLIKNIYQSTKGLLKNSQQSVQANHQDNDPLVTWGRELGGLYKQETEYEIKALKDKDHSVYYEAAFNDATDRIEAIIDYISAQKADSLEGALIQTMCLYDKAHVAASANGEDELDRGIARLAHSIVGVLLRHASINGEDFALKRFMGDNCNPWVEVSERVAALEYDIADEEKIALSA